MTTPHGTSGERTIDSPDGISALEDTIGCWDELQHCPEDDISVVSGSGAHTSGAGGATTVPDTPTDAIFLPDDPTSPSATSSGLENKYLKTQSNQRGLKLLQKSLVYERIRQ